MSDRIINVHCTFCNWDGRCPEGEIDDCCPGCGEYEVLARSREDDDRETIQEGDYRYYRNPGSADR